MKPKSVIILKVSAFSNTSRALVPPEIAPTSSFSPPIIKFKSVLLRFCYFVLKRQFFNYRLTNNFMIPHSHFGEFSLFSLFLSFFDLLSVSLSLNTQRMDLGECPKVHDLALRADYEKAAKHKDYYYDIDVSISTTTLQLAMG